ncbi:predicted MutT-like hydrolases [Malacoplasma penetrans HF-2]|uniref:Predicted MutT-like hydrolases n=1 Tax=Malacoplasma penetrans (strain HF-2) TaxID=272633 RepID=Q8EWA7_MALP2|nr:NUDIX hydrolase [Malacoplasma penetrans]BAC44089.1 predicted MutT-like hydrolases [Malacoplasma penetrans HF-2]
MTKNNKLIIKTKYLSMYKTEKGFYYCQRASINSVALLCYKKENNEYLFLIRYQPLPEIEEKERWDQLYPCPITGSIDENEIPIETVIRECWEEAGIKINKDLVYEINPSIATTQMNEKIFFYLCDVTGLKESIPENDGSIFESVSKNLWVTEKELLNLIDNQICMQGLSICYFHFLKIKNKLVFSSVKKD